jgi:hypothetical protein
VFTSNKKGNGVTFPVFGCGKTKVLLVKQQLVKVLTPADFSMIWYMFALRLCSDSRQNSTI